ncbi:hypothetical protein H6G74_02510 [Nostoc spongiaeforme FACHB-130]|uniref:PEP-CTERM protein-sorting domain-containing protein n=1 Tax=Nostoc spongiaeforme FACHB-130 TaxID=1357510 RepID=A0ABR8FS87_9NOSO|nr:hypothetical protein [Nostoc spongiaeforme]MBD2593200.1 hypothetical protein [Nostoc spongiaeforme FACHB-130]
MKYSQTKITKAVLFSGGLGVMSFILLINVEHSIAANYYKPSPLCKTSVPEPYPLISVLALGILGGGYLIKQRMRKKVNDFDNSYSSINTYTQNHQQPQPIPFINSDEESEENYYPLSASLKLQLIDPTEIL